MARWFAVIVSALLALCAGNALAQAAYVHNLNGTATASTGGTQRALRIGDLLASGTVIATGEQSNAVIKFEDGQVMVLGEKSSFRIVEYRYNKQRVADSSAVFNLIRGGLRFITGVIGATNRNSFRMTAGTATIGIRGTSAIVQYDSVAQAVIAAVYVGSLEMVTKDGSVVAGVGEMITHTQGKPPTTNPTTQATASTTFILNMLLAIEAPINRPAALAAAAAAAAAVADARRLAALLKADPNNETLKQQAAAAATLAEDLVQKAIQAAELAYDEAIKGGAVEPEPDAALVQDEALKGQINQMITPGGTPCSIASCN